MRLRRPVAPACRTVVVRVEPDPNDPNRVIVTDAARNRANMTVRAFENTCVLAAEWAGWESV